jgi:hypothetical protein
MVTTEHDYDVFVNKLHQKYPEMFSGQYGGVCVGVGWWPIIESLCDNIQSHLNHRNGLAKQYPDQHKPVPQVVVEQIKEKFGGLRFYYQGGDDTIYGMVRVAESWANHSCEECGNVGKRTSGGWVKSLCDFHLVEREAVNAQYAKQNGLEL